MQPSLWGEEFIPQETQKKAKKILSKIDKPKKTKTVAQNLKSKTVPIDEKIKIITGEVNKVLGTYADNTIVIKTKEDLDSYIEKAVSNNIIAIDTETNNSLDPITCDLMGLCLYTPGEKNAYIPVNHTDMNDTRLNWQVTEEEIRNSLSKVLGINVIMHNGKFDYKVIKCTCDIELPITWDTMIGAKILDENEKSAGLKQQYINKIDPSIEKYSIDGLFKDVPYKYFDPELFALYAATDAFMTYKLYEWQKEKLYKDDMTRLLDLFLNVEMPIVVISAEMELAGICIDFEYSARLQDKYHKKLDDLEAQISEEVFKYKDAVEAWRQTEDANFHPKAKKPSKDGTYKLQKSKSEQLEWPPKLSSPTQLAILLYDVLKVKAVDKDNPRGTGEEILKKINLPIVELILEQRGLLKLINAFIDVLPNSVSPKDNRLHSNFNQLGTATGRFSSSNPNLQQIPARNKEVRMMFRAAPGYKLIGADYSQQEPRILTAYSRDSKMLEAYNNDKDLYATLGAGVYHNDYWDNMEHHEDGTANVEGKKRRKKMKTLLLGMMYGMGPSLLASNMGCSIQEAKKIIEDFYSGFPELAEWMRKTEEDASKNGYVEDYWGRRRHLPDLLLPTFSIKMLNSKNEFNPLLGSSGKCIDAALIDKYTRLLNDNYNDKAFDFEKYNSIKDAAYKEGVDIQKNGGFIGRAKRQCVNARIQGGAATMTKKAMIDIYNDDVLKSYGFKLLIGVHDELIGECKEEFAEECAERLVFLMKNCVKELGVPIKCDPTIEYHWNEEEYINGIKAEFEKCNDINIIANEHPECPLEELEKILK